MFESTKYEKIEAYDIFYRGIYDKHNQSKLIKKYDKIN